jgi:hypothetical protein
MFSYKYKNRSNQRNQKDKKAKFILSYKKQSFSEQKIKNNSILKTPDKLNPRYKNSLNKIVKFNIKEDNDKKISNKNEKDKARDSTNKIINSNIKDRNKENKVNCSKMKTYSANSLDVNETLSQNNSLKKFQIKPNSNSNRYKGSKTPNKFVKLKAKKIFYNKNDREFDNAFRIKSAEKNSLHKRRHMEELLKDELNFKQKEKLKKLKYLFFWLETKQKTIGRNNKEIFNLEKGKKINFCRNKNIHKYVPSVNYNKTNLFYNKKYDLILDNLHTQKQHKQSVINEYNSKYFNRQQSSSFEKKTFDSKNRNSKESITIKTSKTIRDENRNESDKKSGGKQIKNTIFTDIEVSPNNNEINGKNYSSINNYYRIGKFIKKNDKRCRSSYGIKKYSNENYSKILKRGYNKLLFPLTQRLISESNLLSEQISSERKNEKYLERFGDEDIKKHKLKQKKNAKVDLNKIINDFELYNTKSYINETNIILKGVKRIEKLLTNQKEINFARHVAQKVINEDILANNYFDYDATYNVRLKQISERKLFSKFAGDTAHSKNKMKLQNKKKNEKDRLFKLLKGGLENFFDKKSLEFMIFKHKVANLNPGKIFD